MSYEFLGDEDRQWVREWLKKRFGFRQWSPYEFRAKSRVPEVIALRALADLEMRETQVRLLQRRVADLEVRAALVSTLEQELARLGGAPTSRSAAVSATPPP